MLIRDDLSLVGDRAGGWRFRARRLLVVGCFGLVAGCFGGAAPEEPEEVPTLAEAEVVRRIPTHVQDRSGWAHDILAAIQAAKRPPTIERVCAVVAIIQQESGFDANPGVDNLPHLVRQGLRKKLVSLGPLADAALAALLTGKAPGTKQSFGERIDHLRTEQDLDVFFRDLATAYHDAMPDTYAVATGLSWLIGKGSLQNLNPITTAGSMQVKVWYAKTLDPDLSDEEVRDKLYTRAGGIRAGTARLIGYNAAYDDVIYRFADYNGGIYSSRNAAFQALLADVTGEPLILDGDLLSYDEHGDAKRDETKSLHAMLTFAKQHDLWDWTVERDVTKEKSADFEQTNTWEAVRQAWQEKTGKEPRYARMPQIELASPKIKRKLTNQWYAESVKRHYAACRASE